MRKRASCSGGIIGHPGNWPEQNDLSRGGTEMGLLCEPKQWSGLNCGVSASSIADGSKVTDPQLLGPAYAAFSVVKKAVYKADGSNGGFISATLAPLDRKAQRTFGTLEAIIITTLIVGTVGLMRFLLAH